MSSVPEELVPLLQAVAEQGASDLHLRSNTYARLRVLGALVTLGEDPLSGDEVTRMVRGAMDEGVLAEFERTHEADFAVGLAGVGRFRVNAFRARGSDGAVFRLIGSAPVPLPELGMPEAVHRLAMRPRGLVLVTGPTGSGKSTTLTSMVDAINERKAVHILTLEDPIEVLHRDKEAVVTQRELGSDTRDWGSALRAAMRQDPDVILIGELRDAETVKAALSAAETGHMVLSSMHTTDTKETVLRIVDFFPPHEQPRVRAALGASLEGVVCQRLIPAADGRGRVVALEIAVRDARLAEAVADPSRTGEIPDILAEGQYSGMQTFDQHLLELVVSGRIDLRTGTMSASNPHDFSVMLRRTGWTPGSPPRPPRPLEVAG